VDAFLVKQDMRMRRTNPQPKRTPSDHQKRIRFLTGLSIVIVVILVTGLFLLINREQLSAH